LYVKASEEGGGVLKPVLILDYSVDGLSGGTIGGRLACASEVARVTPADPFPEVDPTGYSGIIHTGSALSITVDQSFTGQASRLVQACVRFRVPQMGICYGHQLICLSLMGPQVVRKAPLGPEIGWLPVEILPPGPPDTLESEIVWQSHYDEVTHVPSGAVVLARSAVSEVQAFLDRGRGILGTQFHPEFSAMTGNAQFLLDKSLFAKHGINIDSVLASAPERDAGALFLGYFLRMTRGETI
jgi:GMP synthase (glutamine-hydrolysing)